MGPLSRNVELQHQVAAGRSGFRVGQESVEDGCCQPERRVGDDPKRLLRHWPLEEVGSDDIDSGGEAMCCSSVHELSHDRLVALDRDHPSAHCGARERQCAATGADVDDEVADVNVERRNDPIDERSIDEKVLPETTTSLVARRSLGSPNAGSPGYLPGHDTPSP